MKTRTIKAYVEVFKRYENGNLKRVFGAAHRYAPCRVEVVRR